MKVECNIDFRFLIEMLWNILRMLACLASDLNGYRTVVLVQFQSRFTPVRLLIIRMHCRS